MYKKTGPKKEKKANASGVLSCADVIIPVGKLKLNYLTERVPLDNVDRFITVYQRINYRNRGSSDTW